MDTGELYAKITQMRTASSSIGRSTAQVNECLENIDIELRALSADRFMSIGAETFRGEYQRLMPKVRATFEGLHAFSEKLNSSADDIELAARSAK